MEKASIIVSGATSQVGLFLLPRLTEAGFHVHALSRTGPKEAKTPLDPHVTWRRTDISTQGNGLTIEGASHAVHLAPVWLLPDFMDNLLRMGIRRVVALSSTSRFSKMTSPNHEERKIADKLASAEEQVVNQCVTYGIDWTFFRPTMIYGAGIDKNVTVIARFIQRFGFFPLVGKGSGRRQPVHADDIAGACQRVMHDPLTFNRAYNLSGGQTLTFREMVEAIFRALHKRPRFMIIPPAMVYPLILSGTYTKTYRHINKEMIHRMDMDMCFDSSDATRDFGYSPRGFQYPV
jgi:nucleoside-diphosphate-sugar epimerase